MIYSKHTFLLSILSVSILSTFASANTTVAQPEEVVNTFCQCLNSGLKNGSKSLEDCYNDYLSKVNTITQANSKTDAELISNHIREKTAECLNKFTGIEPGQARDIKPVLPTLSENAPLQTDSKAN